MNDNQQDLIDGMTQKVYELISEESFDDAIDLALEMIELANNVYGKKHFEYISARGNLAYIYQLTGEFDKAKYLYQEVYQYCLFQNTIDEYTIKITIRLAEILKEQNNFNESISLFQQASGYICTVLGEEHPFYIYVLKGLAELYENIDNYNETEFLLKKIVEVQEKILREEHPDFIKDLTNLAFFYQEKVCKFKDAKEVYQRVIELARKIYGEEHLDYAIILNNFGLLLVDSGEYTTAKQLYKQVLIIRRKLLGEGDPGYASTLNNLGALYTEIGDYSSAERVLKEALAILEPDNPFFQLTQNNLAILYESKGELDSAEKLYQQLLEHYRRTFGEEHFNYHICLNNLADLYISMSEFKNAEPLLEKSLKIVKKNRGNEHPDYATVLYNKARLYIQKGEFRLAEEMAQKVIDLRKKIFGDKHPDYAKSLRLLSSLYESKGEYKLAKEMDQKILDIRQETLGEEHPDYAKSLNDMGLFYSSIGDFNSARQSYSDAYKIMKKLGGNHPDCISILFNIGDLYLLEGDYEFAEEVFLECLDRTQNNFGDKSLKNSSILNALGTLYHQNKQYGLAESYYEKAKEIISNKITSKSEKYILILGNIASLHYDTGNYSKAIFFSHQALKSSKRLGDNNIIYGECLFNLSLLYIASNKAKEGVNLCLKALKISDKIIWKIFSVSSERQRISYLQTIKYQCDVLLSAINLNQFPLNLLNQSFETILKRKGTLTEIITAQRDIVLKKQYSNLTHNFNELNDLRMQITKLTFDGPGPEGVLAHQRFVDRLEFNKEEFESKLAEKIPEVELARCLKNCDIKAISSIIPNGAALIEFIKFDVFNFKAIVSNGDEQWGHSNYMAFIVFHNDPENIKIVDLGESESIDILISDYRAEIINNPSERHKRDMSFSQKGLNAEYKSDAGYKLKTTLFDPILKAIGDIKQLFISPDANLSKIPFEVIPLDDGRYLIDEYQISYLSVGRDLLRFRAESIGTISKPMVIADPDFDLGNDDMSDFHKFNDEIIPISINEKHQEPSTNQTVNVSSPISNKKSNIIVFPGTKLSEPEPKLSQTIGDQEVQLTKNNLIRNFEGNDITFNRLPGTKEEGDDIAKIMGVKPMMNIQALESTLKKCNSPKILHIASHGFFLSDQERALDNDLRAFSMTNFNAGFANRNFSADKLYNPMLRSGLALAGINTWLKGGQPPAEAEDGILTAEDVTGLNLINTELVVLSACETGLGEIQTGEGVFGLRRAFVIAGAKTLVMSLWKVPDKQTKELMVNFYERLLNGEIRSEALRNAQIKIRKQYPDPYYWGAFICQGDHRPLA